MDDDIILLAESRECWNWQTGTFEGRVLHDVWVQVPSRAPNKKAAWILRKSVVHVASFIFCLRLNLQVYVHRFEHKKG